jgi:hypothetical protein
VNLGRIFQKSKAPRSGRGDIVADALEEGARRVATLQKETDPKRNVSPSMKRRMP